MRRVLGFVLVTSLFLLAGCQLYFDGGPGNGSGSGSGGSGWVPDSGPHNWPDASTDAMARCEDGTLYKVGPPNFSSDQPGHGAGTVFGQCPGECRSAVVACTSSSCSNAAATLCQAPASEGRACALDGTACSGTATIECPQSTTCGYSVPGSACTCSNGTYDCTPHSDVAGVHAALVGKWRGTVNPPDFSAPYEVSLWIYPDGTYWGECNEPSCSAFYYGGDGPHPWRKIEVLSASPTEGAWANIGVFTDFNVGALSALTVNSTNLAFTYNASWHNCGQPFFFNLTRE